MRSRAYFFQRGDAFCRAPLMNGWFDFLRAPIMPGTIHTRDFCAIEKPELDERPRTSFRELSRPAIMRGIAFIGLPRAYGDMVQTRRRRA